MTPVVVIRPSQGLSCAHTDSYPGPLKDWAENPPFAAARAMSSSILKSLLSHQPPSAETYDSYHATNAELLSHRVEYSKTIGATTATGAERAISEGGHVHVPEGAVSIGGHVQFPKRTISERGHVVGTSKRSIFNACECAHLYFLSSSDEPSFFRLLAQINAERDSDNHPRPRGDSCINFVARKTKNAPDCFHWVFSSPNGSESSI